MFWGTDMMTKQAMSRILGLHLLSHWVENNCRSMSEFAVIHFIGFVKLSVHDGAAVAVAALRADAQTDYASVRPYHSAFRKPGKLTVSEWVGKVKTFYWQACSLALSLSLPLTSPMDVTAGYKAIRALCCCLCNKKTFEAWLQNDDEESSCWSSAELCYCCCCWYCRCCRCSNKWSEPFSSHKILMVIHLFWIYKVKGAGEVEEKSIKSAQ